MNSTAAQQQTAQTAENILSEQKSFRTVQFAITGNADADAVAGILALLAQPDWKFFTQRAKQRILEFLAARFKDEADEMDRFNASMQMHQRVSPQPDLRPPYVINSGGTSFPGPIPDPIYQGTTAVKPPGDAFWKTQP